jgi:NAD(P)-dependent dehydrogenase (short-subunit alcohol dehydrogenase family)
VFELNERIALVTGAGQGVGAGIARLFAANGATVAVNDLHESRAESVANEIRKSGGHAIVAPFDVADFAAAQAGIRAIETKLGGIDILVNNAGVPESMALQPFRESDPVDWKPFVDINLFGVMNCSRAVIEGMCERNHGRVITISSGAGTVGLSIGVSPYAAGKGGGISFMRHLAIEHAGFGVTANSIALGLIDNHTDPSLTKRIAASIPVGRPGRPEDVAALCLYLASDEAAWMTGQTLELNGGSGTT